MSDDYYDSSQYDEMVEHISEEAVNTFTSDRLRFFYDKEPAIAENPFKALEEARALLQTSHYTAAFIHAAIASEVMLKEVVLKPILLGFIHSDSIAPYIVNLAFRSTPLDRIGKLLAKIFQDVSRLDLMAHRRRGGVKLFWQEIVEVQNRRNLIMHKADVATKDEAEQAIAVATAVTEELFPSFAKSLGYHLHDEYRLCSKQSCALPDHIRTMIEQAQSANTPKPGLS